jgi:hypothetical protein
MRTERARHRHKPVSGWEVDPARIDKTDFMNGWVHGSAVWALTPARQWLLGGRRTLDCGTIPIVDFHPGRWPSFQKCLVSPRGLFRPCFEFFRQPDVLGCLPADPSGLRYNLTGVRNQLDRFRRHLPPPAGLGRFLRGDLWQSCKPSAERSEIQQAYRQRYARAIPAPPKAVPLGLERSGGLRGPSWARWASASFIRFDVHQGLPYRPDHATPLVVGRPRCRVVRTTAQVRWHVEVERKHRPDSGPYPCASGLRHAPPSRTCPGSRVTLLR